jgi:LysM repeat protein
METGEDISESLSSGLVVDPLMATGLSNQEKSGLSILIDNLSQQTMLQVESKENSLVENCSENVSKEKSEVYIVQEGDTLLRISMKLNISMARLKKYNHLFGKHDVIIGQVASLPLIDSSLVEFKIDRKANGL